MVLGVQRVMCRWNMQELAMHIPDICYAMVQRWLNLFSLLIALGGEVPLMVFTIVHSVLSSVHSSKFPKGLSIIIIDILHDSTYIYKIQPFIDFLPSPLKCTLPFNPLRILNMLIRQWPFYRTEFVFKKTSPTACTTVQAGIHLQSCATCVLSVGTLEGLRNIDRCHVYQSTGSTEAA